MSQDVNCSYSFDESRYTDEVLDKLKSLIEDKKMLAENLENLMLKERLQSEQRA